MPSQDQADDFEYRCPVCHRRFVSFSKLDEHMLQHRGEVKQ